jgi:tetratricopeptide (TPR) repeat protein
VQIDSLVVDFDTSPKAYCHPILDLRYAKAAMNTTAPSQYDDSPISFFQQSSVKAATYRLSLARRARHGQDMHIFEQDFPNIWHAVQDCYERKDWSRVLSFRDILQPLLDNRGAWDQCLVLLAWTYEATCSIGDSTAAAGCLHDQGDILNQRGQYREAEEHYRAAEQAYGGIGAADVAIKSRHMRSMVVRAQGRLNEAMQLSESVIVEAKALALGRWLAHPLYVRGLLARDINDFVEARRCVMDGLALLEATDELVMIAQCHHFLGEVALLEGNLTLARTELEHSLELSQQVGILRRIATTKRLLADLALRQGRLVDADCLYREAMDIAGQLGDQSQLARILLARSQLLASLGQKGHARDLLRSAYTIYEQIGDQRGATITSAILAWQEFLQWHVVTSVSLMLRTGRFAWQAKLIRPRVLMGLWRRRNGL